jgi:hypothetical protein
MKETTFRRIMHAILIILMAYPIINPIGIPVRVSKETRGFYEAIEEVDKLDDGVIVAQFKLAPGSYGSCEGTYLAILKHLLSLENARVLCYTQFSAPAFGQFLAALETLGESWIEKREYGKDWVILGFIPGEEATTSATAEDLIGTFQTDHYGDNLADMEISEGIGDASTWDLYVGITGGFPDNGPIVRQIVQVYGTPFYCMTTGAALPSSMPFVESGDIESIISGDHGGEYEILIDAPGVGVASSDSQSLAHIYAIILVIIGNGTMLLKKEEET